MLTQRLPTDSPQDVPAFSKLAARRKAVTHCDGAPARPAAGVPAAGLFSWQAQHEVIHMLPLHGIRQGASMGCRC